MSDMTSVTAEFTDEKDFRDALKALLHAGKIDDAWRLAGAPQHAKWNAGAIVFYYIEDGYVHEPNDGFGDDNITAYDQNRLNQRRQTNLEVDGNKETNAGIPETKHLQPTNQPVNETHEDHVSDSTSRPQISTAKHPPNLDVEGRDPNEPWFVQEYRNQNLMDPSWPQYIGDLKETVPQYLQEKFGKLSQPPIHQPPPGPPLSYPKLRSIEEVLNIMDETEVNIQIPSEAALSLCRQARDVRYGPPNEQVRAPISDALIHQLLFSGTS